MTQPLTLPPPYPHVNFDESGNPKIEGTTMKVVELVAAHQAYGWSPEELHFQFPHLTLGQIHSALAFYRDHREQLDRDMERREEYAEKMRREAGSWRLKAKLSPAG